MRYPYALSLLAATLVALPAHADQSWTFSGAVAEGPTYLRPEEDLTASPTSVYYQVQSFRVPETGACAIYSAQDFDGFLALYEESFDPAKPLENLVAADDDGDLGGLTSMIGPMVLRKEKTYRLVTSSYIPLVTGRFDTTLQCDADLRAGQIVHGDCTARTDGTETCILGNRFRVAVQWQRRTGAMARAKVAPISADGQAVFSYAGNGNWDLMVRVSDTCKRNGHFGVTASAMTALPYTVTVVDTQSPAKTSYKLSAAAGQGLRTDPAALPCTPAH